MCEIHQHAHKSPTRPALTYATPFRRQFYLVFKRMVITYWRSPNYSIGRFVILISAFLLSGFTYWRLGNSVSDMQSRLFVLFLAFMSSYILIICSQPKFMTERIYFRREHACRYYGWVPFGLSIILVEIPYILLLGACFMVCFYRTTGLVNLSETVGYFYILNIFFISWAVTLGFVIASVAESPTMVATINPIVISMLVLFTGFMQPVSAMPRFWSSWMYWVNPMHYFVEGLVTNE